MQEKGEAVKINDKGFVVCPKCGKQTKTKVLPDTELKRFPLFCPGCKQVTVVDIAAGDCHASERAGSQ